MHIVATFEYSTTLEMAVQTLISRGIPHGHIVAVTLDRRVEQARVFDTIHRSDGKSMIDVASIWAVIFMLLGTIYGFVLHWGPIIWGAIGLITGALFGFLIDFVFTKRSKQRTRAHYEKTTEVIILVKCLNREQQQLVEETFWDHFALGIGRLARKSRNSKQTAT